MKSNIDSLAQALENKSQELEDKIKRGIDPQFSSLADVHIAIEKLARAQALYDIKYPRRHITYVIDPAASQNQYKTNRDQARIELKNIVMDKAYMRFERLSRKVEGSLSSFNIEEMTGTPEEKEILDAIHQDCLQMIIDQGATVDLVRMGLRELRKTLYRQFTLCNQLIEKNNELAISPKPR